MTHPRTPWVAALALLALAAPLRADYLPAWTYSWTAVPLSVLSDPPGTGNIALNSNPGTVTSAVGASFIPAANLQTMSTASPSSPDQFSSGGQYQLFLTITDTQAATAGLTPSSHTFEIDGKITGTISSGGTLLTNTFTSGSLTYNLGNTAYTVSPESFVPPGPPGASNVGAIGALVTVAALNPGNPGTTGFSTPEPSSLLLCSLGATSCAFAGWRRRRRAR